MQKQIVTAGMEVTRKRISPRKWTEEAEKDLKTMGTAKWYAVTKDRKEGSRTLLVTKVRDGV
jgi:hypothetical protein